MAKKKLKAAEPLEFFKYDPVIDAEKTFNIDLALNENWDKVKAEFEKQSGELESHNVDPTSHQDIRDMIENIDASWNGITGKPESFPPSEHTHDDRYYTETEVNGLLANKANTSHTHTKAQITDFPTSLPANGGNADTVDGLHGNQFARTDVATTFYNSVTINYPQSLNVRHIDGANNAELYLNYASQKQVYMTTPETGMINLGYEIANTKALSLGASARYNLHESNVIEVLSSSRVVNYGNHMLVGKFTPKYDGAVYLNYNISTVVSNGYAEIHIMSPNDVIYDSGSVLSNNHYTLETTPVGGILAGDHMYRKNFMYLQHTTAKNPYISIPLSVKKGVPVYVTLRPVNSYTPQIVIDYVRILGSVVNN